MDKEKYLKNKKIISKDFFQEREICYSCLKPKASCLCEHLKPFATKTKLVILIHIKEARKERVGTGRLSHLILKDSLLITGVDFSQDKQVNELLENEKYFPVILYPGKNALNLSKESITKTVPKNKQLLVFIIDGTWFFAKKMLRESKNLHNIPRISFESKDLSKFDIKQQPAKFCLSTIEAIHRLISELNNQNVESLTDEHDNLTDTLKRLVEFQMACANNRAVRGYRKRKFKNITERTPSQGKGKRKRC